MNRVPMPAFHPICEVAAHSSLPAAVPADAPTQPIWFIVTPASMYGETLDSESDEPTDRLSEAEVIVRAPVAGSADPSGDCLRPKRSYAASTRRLAGISGSQTSSVARARHPGFAWSCNTPDGIAMPAPAPARTRPWAPSGVVRVSSEINRPTAVSSQRIEV